MEISKKDCSQYSPILQLLNDQPKKSHYHLLTSHLDKLIIFDLDIESNSCIILTIKLFNISRLDIFLLKWPSRYFASFL